MKNFFLATAVLLAFNSFVFAEGDDAPPAPNSGLWRCVGSIPKFGAAGVGIEGRAERTEVLAKKSFYEVCTQKAGSQSDCLLEGCRPVL